MISPAMLGATIEGNCQPHPNIAIYLPRMSSGANFATIDPETGIMIITPKPA